MPDKCFRKCADSHLSDDPKPNLFRLQKHAGSYKFLFHGGGNFGCVLIIRPESARPRAQRRSIAPCPDQYFTPLGPACIAAPGDGRSPKNAGVMVGSIKMHPGNSRSLGSSVLKRRAYEKSRGGKRCGSPCSKGATNPPEQTLIVLVFLDAIEASAVRGVWVNDRERVGGEEE